ncbi:hypothetical protein tb265_39340 [Gemmatimonadetes bacterium T265]|nr:hypothetical protein tb265_39340 [Gemmatimonadetes bacterium T265]
MPRFKKIKFDGATVTLEWTDGGRKWEKVEVFTGRELPHPDFTAALAACVPVVLDLLELPDEYAHGMTVRGVSLSVDDEGHEGAVVTCLKALDAVPAPLVLNTPHVSTRENAEGEPSMPDALGDALETIKREAQCYLAGGKRAQADLFSDAEIDAAEAAGV